MLAAVEDAIIDTVKATLGNRVRAVEVLPGDWGSDTLQHVLGAVPGVFVHWDGGRARDQAQLAVVDARFIVYACTGHQSGHRERRRGGPTQIGAYEIVRTLVPVLHGLDAAGEGRLQLEQVRNLFSGQVSKRALAIYAIDLRLPLVFPAPVEAQELAPFELYAAEHQVGDSDTANVHTRALPPQE